MENYRIGNEIVTPTRRYVHSSGGLNKMQMYHSDTVDNDKKVEIIGKGGIKVTPRYLTKTEKGLCHNMDESGFCRGHAMSLPQFLIQFTGGVMPEELK